MHMHIHKTRQQHFSLAIYLQTIRRGTADMIGYGLYPPGSYKDIPDRTDGLAEYICILYQNCLFFFHGSDFYKSHKIKKNSAKDKIKKDNFTNFN